MTEEILLVFEFHSGREIVSRFIYCVIANLSFIYYFDFIIYCAQLFDDVTFPLFALLRWKSISAIVRYSFKYLSALIWKGCPFEWKRSVL